MAVIRESQFLKHIALNKRINKLKSRLDAGAYAIDTKKLIEELTTLHEGRVFRAYISKEVLRAAQLKLVRAAIQEASVRSRATTIRMECFKVSELLKEDLDNASGYISTRYGDLLAQEFKTVEARKDAIRHVLEGFHRLSRKLKTVMDLADMVIKDIDQTSYSIKAVLDTLQLSSRPERNV